MSAFTPLQDFMTSPACLSSPECRLLLQLRDLPELFAEIAASSAAELQNQRRLRQHFAEDLVRAALSLHAARGLAASLLPAAAQLWLTRVGLEQSTAWDVARHKAQRFAVSDTDAPTPVFDLCCGIGVDATALAQHVPVVAVDHDPAMCLRTLWNAEIWHTRYPVRGQCQDVAQQDWTDCLVHADPDRRGGRDRPVKRLEQYQPDLGWMQLLTRTARGGAIKLSPAANFMQKFAGCEIELISLQGECREATVWFGSLAGTHAFRATVLPSAETVSADPLSAWAPQAAACDAWIYDPDPAVVRSGLLDVVAEQLELSRLDPEEEYLTGSRVVTSGFVTGFQVETVLPNCVKELRHWLRADPSRYYEVKCRRIPVNAAAVQKQLPSGSAAPRVILFARIAGRARIVVARRTNCSPVMPGPAEPHAPEQ